MNHVLIFLGAIFLFGTLLIVFIKFMNRREEKRKLLFVQRSVGHYKKEIEQGLSGMDLSQQPIPIEFILFSFSKKRQLPFDDLYTLFYKWKKNPTFLNLKGKREKNSEKICIIENPAEKFQSVAMDLSGEMFINFDLAMDFLVYLLVKRFNNKVIFKPGKFLKFFR